MNNPHSLDFTPLDVVFAIVGFPFALLVVLFVYIGRDSNAK